MMPATTSTEKRVVFVHPDGMHQIMGISPEPPIVATVRPMERLGRTIPFASLVRVTRSMAIYKEPIIPASYSFNEAQR